MLLRALDAAGGIVYWQGDMEAARDAYRRQTEVARQLGDERGQAEAMYNESMSYALQSDSAEARRLSRAALDKFRALGDRHGEGRAQWAYLNALAYDADAEAGEPLAAETVAIFREVDDRFMLAWALYTQALILTQSRRVDPARVALTEALNIFQETDDISGYALVLDGFAALEWLTGNRDLAMRIAGAAAAIQDVSGVGLAQRNREQTQFFPADLLEEAPLAEAYAEGQKLTPEEAVRLALGR
jgi:tetratricopeptide (TPR) repeat protein